MEGLGTGRGLSRVLAWVRCCCQEPSKGRARQSSSQGPDRCGGGEQSGLCVRACRQVSAAGYLMSHTIGAYTVD